MLDSDRAYLLIRSVQTLLLLIVNWVRKPGAVVSVDSNRVALPRDDVCHYKESSTIRDPNSVTSIIKIDLCHFSISKRVINTFILNSNEASP